MIKKTLFRWLPAILIMAIIFGFSSIPSRDMPDLGLWNMLIQKGGHVLGYGFLSLSFWAGLQFDKRRWWLALLLTLLYAITDELHQSFVPGRHPSWVDILFFDGGSAATALALVYWRRAKRALSIKNE
jgi:VanZ family protein